MWYAQPQGLPVDLLSAAQARTRRPMPRRLPRARHSSTPLTSPLVRPPTSMQAVPSLSWSQVLPKLDGRTRRPPMEYFLRCPNVTMADLAQHILAYLGYCGARQDACQNFDASTIKYFKFYEKKNGIADLGASI